MVKAFILSEVKTKWRHSLKILVIMKEYSWIQTVSFWYDKKEFKQYTMPMDKSELENIAKAMGGMKNENG